MRTDDFTNPQLVTMAVGLLNGDTEYVDSEDIAVTVNDIAPGRFNWRRYPERIDLKAVSYALRDAKKSKCGRLLVGSNAAGWMLSPLGLTWIRTLDLGALQGAQPSTYRRDSIPANLEAECERLRGTRAYSLYTQGDPEAIALEDFYRFARVNEYFQTRARRRRYTIIDNAVVDDETLSRLWVSLKERFAEEMR